MYCGAAVAGLCLACQAAERCRWLARGPAGEANPVPKEIVAGARRKPTDGQDEVAGRVLGNRPRAHRTSSSASFANGGPGSRALGHPQGRILSPWDMDPWQVLGFDLGLRKPGQYCPCILGHKRGKLRRPCPPSGNGQSAE